MLTRKAIAIDTSTGNTFKSYNNIVDKMEDQTYHRGTRKRLIIITLSTVVLITVIIGALVGILVPKSSTKSKQTPTDSITSMCNVTRYPESCYSSIAALKSSSNITDPNPNLEELFKISLQVSINELTTRLSSWPSELLSSEAYNNITNNPAVQAALGDCKVLIEDAIDHIDESIKSFEAYQGQKKMSFSSMINDIRTWLSTAITDQETCLDGIKEAENNTILREEMRRVMRNSTEYTSNSLAIASNIMTILVHQVQTPPSPRKLLMIDHGHHRNDFDADFPEWIHNGYRRLLQEENLRPNITVAQDGSGDFRTINEAINSIPKKETSRFIIHVKEGVYVENVVVGKQHWNVMIYGDGMNKTIVSGSLNKVDGTSTFKSGSFIAEGRGFIASDMGFRNTAGPQKEQAVALRSSSDKSFFYRCSFDAYQDTLYTYSNRQFYFDCHIIGTIDFIFGNAAVVLQNCSIQPRQPMSNQFNTITAQSKTDPNQNTGISIQRCRITPFDNLTATTTFLGRPWKDYATTVFMQSDIGGFVDPRGWAQWTEGVDPPSSIFYAEYQNVGPGSATGERVKWAGFRPSISDEQAAKFSLESFIQGSHWLPEARSTLDGSLL